MFNVSLGCVRNDKTMDFTIRIEGCPPKGIEAVDFRKAHKLPPAPTDKIDLPGYTFPDEAFVRGNPQRANESADVVLEYVTQYVSCCNRVGEVYKGSSVCTLGGQGGYFLHAEPWAIAAYLENRHPNNAKALFMSIWGFEHRSRRIAENEAAAIAAKKKEAREVLKGEFDELNREIETLKTQVARLEEQEDDG